MNLAEYERRKFELTEIVRGVAAVGPRMTGNDDILRELFARLAEDRFNLVVVGRFSRGKSSLMNAILGLDRLPTGILPLTSVITSVSYGSEEGVELTFEGSSLVTTIELEELPRYVTQGGNPGNEKGVKVAVVRLPAEILRRGFYFIDTPGLGSSTVENTRTTQSFLPAGDAFLLVTSYEAPLSEDELSFLQTARLSGRRIFVAVNKQDAVTPSERAEVLTYLHQQLAALFETNPPATFSTSAVEGLAAKLAGDQQKLDASGVADLERAIIEFLVNEKSREFLLRMCDRVEQILQTLSRTEASAALLRRLGDVRVQLGSLPGSPARGSALGGLAAAGSERAGSCEICRAMDDATFEFLSQHQYDLTVSDVEQEKLAEQRGLCGLHTWVYNNVASRHGVAMGYPRLLERWRDQLGDLADDPAVTASAAASAIEANLPTRDSCQVCQASDRAERAALAALSSRLAGGTAFDSLSALCLRHVAALLRSVECEPLVSQLLRREAGLFERVAEDMRRYALKRDALRRQLSSGAEDRAADRALRLLAGLPNLSLARRID
jgi:GTP-binding protein EngB required for normal cell division